MVLDSDNFVMAFTMTQEEFEASWNTFPSTYTALCRLDVEQAITNEQFLTEETVEELFKSWGLMTMGSAEEGDQLQFFLYGKAVLDGDRESVIAVQLGADRRERRLTLSIRSPSERMSSAVRQYVLHFLRLNEFVAAE